MVSLDPTLPRILPADIDGPTPAPSGAPQPIVTDNDDGVGFPEDRIDVWNATMTWGATPTISVVREGYLPAAPFDQGLGTTCPAAAVSDSASRSPGRAFGSTRCRTARCTGLHTGIFGSHQALAYTHTVDADAPSGTGPASAGTS